MAEAKHQDLEQALSQERFARYVGWSAGDRDHAIALYTLNTRLSESLYTPLQVLEVTLRNRAHVVMTTIRHEGWFHDAGALLGSRQPEQLSSAMDDIARERKDPTSGRVVAALTFSFWTSMLGTPYETLWQQGLHRIARRPDGKGFRRKDFAGPLTPIRILRNRIAHHEPILDWDLDKHHAKMVELTQWLSPAAADWCRQNDRFEQVYPSERIALVKRAGPIETT